MDHVHELGKLYFDRAEFDKATPYLLEASKSYFQKRNFTEYLDCINRLLRIYNEREEYDEIHAAKEKLQDLVLNEGFELNAKTYYTLAVCAYSKSQFETALDYLQKSLAIALAADNKEDICHAIFMLAVVYSAPAVGKYTDALKEIYNLQVFFQVIDLPKLKFSTMVLNADILRQMKKYEEAIDLCWKAYDELKVIRNILDQAYLLAMLGLVYFDAGDKDMSRLYATMAMKTLDPKNHVKLHKIVKSYFDQLGGSADQAYDLVFSQENHAVVERKLGKIDFKNQFILLDLLRLFMQNQGIVYSKEYLVEHVWKQPYDPSVHDNKIYVTIKRLRKLIEPDYEKPKYIFRAKNGYYMNKTARILIEH